MLRRDADKGLTEEDASHRLASQLPLKDKIPYADVVLDNAADSPDAAAAAGASIQKQVDDVVHRWQRTHEHGLGRLRTLVQWLIPPVGIATALWAVLARTQRVAKRKRASEQEARAQ